ncbi:MAG: hypothetical protein IPO21_15515 [Bacteroidales bacterium]|nr:hypothetical protein [Bacteroidales bacterium]
MADENMLLPLLYSLPDTIDKYNISMGYPLVNSSTHTLMKMICELYKQKSSFTINLLSLFSITLLRQTYRDDIEKIEAEIKANTLKKNNWNNIPNTELTNILSPQKDNNFSVISAILNIIKSICIKGKSNINSLDYELFVKIYRN